MVIPTAGLKNRRSTCTSAYGPLHSDNAYIIMLRLRNHRSSQTAKCHLLGTLNYENVMAAVAITRKAGVSMDVIREAVKKFVAVEHRIEYVTEKNGVKYYNDSKGTNPDAAIKAIEAMVSPTVLIGGGYDKDAAFDAWVDAFEGKVKSLILMGATREKIAEACEGKFENITFVESLQHP